MVRKDYQKRYRSSLSTGKLFAIAGGVFASAIAVSATSTYAWYTISEQFRIVGFEIRVSHDEELFKLGKLGDNGEISYQGEEAYSLRDLGVENPVIGNVSNMCVGDYPKTYDPDFLPYFSSGYRVGGTTRMTERATDPRIDPEKAQYVQFDLYAYCEFDAYLYLTPETKTTVNEEANSETAIRKGVDVKELNNVLNAARMSFYTPYGYTIVELGQHEDVTYSGLLDLGGSGYYDVDSENREIVYGVYDGEPEYEPFALEDDEDEYENHDIFHAAHKQGVRKWDPSRGYGEKKEVAHPISEHVYDPESEDFYFNRPTPIGAIKGKTATRIVCSVFLEGWDHDMTVSLVESSFGLNLGFVAELNPEAGQYFS